MHAKSLQSCPTIWDSVGYSLPCSCLGLSRQDYWRGLPFAPLGHLPIPGMEPESLQPPGLTSVSFCYHSSTWEALSLAVQPLQIVEPLRLRFGLVHARCQHWRIRTIQRGIRTTQRIWSNFSPEFGLSRLEKVEAGCFLLMLLGFDHVSPFVLLFSISEENILDYRVIILVDFTSL